MNIVILAFHFIHAWIVAHESVSRRRLPSLVFVSLCMQHLCKTLCCLDVFLDDSASLSLLVNVHMEIRFIGSAFHLGWGSLPLQGHRRWREGL